MFAAASITIRTIIVALFWRATRLISSATRERQSSERKALLINARLSRKLQQLSGCNASRASHALLRRATARGGAKLLRVQFQVCASSLRNSRVPFRRRCLRESRELAKRRVSAATELTASGARCATTREPISCKPLRASCKQTASQSRTESRAVRSCNCALRWRAANCLRPSRSKSRSKEVRLTDCKAACDCQARRRQRLSTETQKTRN